jgi:hypothetical protein
MYQDKKVIIVVPAGRKRYLEILIPYLLNQTIVDEIHFWLNTKNEEDIAFMKSQQNDYIKMIECDNSRNLDPYGHVSRAIGRFLSLSPNDRNIIYIRIDDDICFIEKNAIFNLVKFRYENPNFFLVYGNIVNNLIMDHIHQLYCHKFINLPPIEYKPDGYLRYCGQSLIKLHTQFIEDVITNATYEYFFENHVITNHEPASINAISYFADDAYQLWNSGIALDMEEIALAHDWPLKTGKTNVICGNALFCHFCFYPIRDWVENHSNLIKDYKILSEMYLSANQNRK